MALLRLEAAFINICAFARARLKPNKPVPSGHVPVERRQGERRYYKRNRHATQTKQTPKFKRPRGRQEMWKLVGAFEGVSKAEVLARRLRRKYL